MGWVLVGWYVLLSFLVIYVVLSLGIMGVVLRFEGLDICFFEIFNRYGSFGFFIVERRVSGRFVC